MVSGTIFLLPPLDLELRQVVGSGRFHNFHWCCGGCEVQQNNDNIQQNNSNWRIVQDVTKITYNIIVR